MFNFILITSQITQILHLRMIIHQSWISQGISRNSSTYKYSRHPSTKYTICSRVHLLSGSTCCQYTKHQQDESIDAHHRSDDNEHYLYCFQPVMFNKETLHQRLTNIICIALALTKFNYRLTISTFYRIWCDFLHR